MKTRLTVCFLFLTITFPVLLRAQTCVQGNCQNGFGVLLKDKVYQVGNFVNGKLEGEGKLVTFYELSGYQKNTESDFLLLTAFGMPTLEEILKVRPQVVKQGNFKNGELNGKGLLYATNTEKFSHFKWILGFAKTWLGYFNWNHIRYEGEFARSEPIGLGQVILEMENATIKCTGDDLTNPTKEDVILEIDGKDFNGKGLFRGAFLDGSAHGFVITNVIDGKLAPDKKLRRQVWLYGHIRETGAPDMYPFDEGGTGIHELGNGITYTGPVDDKGKPMGFGTLVKKNSNGVIESMYKGYFHEGKKNGLGFLETTLNFKTKFRIGNFAQDTFKSGTVTRDESLFYVTAAGKFDEYGWPSSTYMSIAEYRSVADFKDGKEAIFYYNGTVNESGKFEGDGTYKQGGTVKTGKWHAGEFVSGKGTIEYSSLSEMNIVVMDGLASGVKKDIRSSGWKTADGRSIPFGTTLLLSKLPRSRFISTCTICDGYGSVSEVHHVAASTTTSSFTVNSSQSVDYLNSYWKTTTTYTTSYSRPAYSYRTNKTCSACGGIPQQLSSITIPEPE